MDCWTDREEPIKDLENNISKTASGGGAPASLPPEERAHMRPSALGGAHGVLGVILVRKSALSTHKCLLKFLWALCFLFFVPSQYIYILFINLSEPTSTCLHLLINFVWDYLVTAVI